MRFVVTKTDIENHPILKKRGYEAGDVADTKYFEPALKLRPSAQERAEAVVHPAAENVPTLEETAEEVKVTKDVEPAKPAAKKSTAKGAKKK